MAMKNKYAYRSKISAAKIRQIVKLFAVDLDASQIAEITSLNRNIINRYLAAFQERIARYCESVIHSDGCHGYDGLVDLGYQKHFRVEHGNNEFANKLPHVNGIASFWAFAKTRLVRFRGLHKHTFYFHLKECEF